MKAEGVVPRDGLVVAATGAQNHRFGEPALLAVPVVGFLREFVDGVVGEELGRQAAGVRFPGDGLRPVLAELGGRAVGVRVGPRAARAIDAAVLIQHFESTDAAAEPCNAKHMPQ